MTTYRYRGSPFRFEVKPGEGPADTVKRLTLEHGVDRPPSQLLRSQVKLVHAIEDIQAAEDWEHAKRHLVEALEAIGEYSHHLTRE